jgi:hypothetical protein
VARELVPAKGFGQALYDLIGSRKRVNGTRWNAKDLAVAIRKDYGVSAKQIREWITGRASPPAVGLIAVADFFSVNASQLLKGVIEPINHPPHSPGVSGDPAGDQGQSVARNRAKAAKAARRTPGHRRSG